MDRSLFHGKMTRIFLEVIQALFILREVSMYNITQFRYFDDNGLTHVFPKVMLVSVIVIGHKSPSVRISLGKFDLSLDIAHGRVILTT